MLETTNLKGGVHQFSTSVMEIRPDERSSNYKDSGLWELSYLTPSNDKKRERQRDHPRDIPVPFAEPFFVI